MSTKDELTERLTTVEEQFQNFQIQARQRIEVLVKSNQLSEQALSEERVKRAAIEVELEKTLAYLQSLDENGQPIDETEADVIQHPSAV